MHPSHPSRPPDLHHCGAVFSVGLCHTPTAYWMLLQVHWCRHAPIFVSFMVNGGWSFPTLPPFVWFQNVWNLTRV